MNCPYCNSPIRPGIIFCTECGKRLPRKRVCPHCGKTYESVVTICPYCGKDAEAPMEKTEPANQQNVVPTETQAPPAPVEQEPRKNSKTIWFLAIAVVLLVAIVYGASEFLSDGGSSSSYSSSSLSSSSSTESSSSQSSSSSNQIPSWMVGNWKCNTQYGTITMTINSDGSGVSDGDDGTFTYEDGDLIFRGQGYDGVVVNYEVDEGNQRLGAGHGYYFQKVTNNSSSSSQSSNYENSGSNNYASSKDLTLIGSIDGKYPITMELRQEGSSLSGSYYYNRNGPDNSLSVYGQLDGSRFRLQEYDDNNNNTGNFVGTYNNGSVTGTFTLADGKTMSFDLEVVN